MTQRGTLTPDQVAQLLEAIRPGRVRQKDGKDHVEGYDIRAHLTRIFGFGRWDLVGEPAELLFEERLATGQDKKNGWPMIRWEVGYRQAVQLIIYDPEGVLVGIYRGEAVGKAENQPSRADAHDGAMKEAETQALKRAAINLGDQFGLGLYNKGARTQGPDGKLAYKATVKRTLVGMPTEAVDQVVDHDAPDVEAEEPDAPAQPEGETSTATVGNVTVTVTDARTQPSRTERADSDHVTQDDVAHLSTIMESLTEEERGAIKAERERLGLSIRPGEFTVGTLRWLLGAAQAQLDRREAAAKLGAQRSAGEDDALNAGAARRRAGGAKLATKEQRTTVATKLGELAPGQRAEVEAWAEGAGHKLGDQLAASSFQPVLTAISNVRRKGALADRAAAAAKPKGNSPAAPANGPQTPDGPPPAPDPDEERRELRRVQWQTINDAVDALGVNETWPMVVEELAEKGLITKDMPNAQMALTFVAAGAEWDELLADMAQSYQDVAAEFMGRPFEQPADGEPPVPAGAPLTPGLDDVEY